MAPRGRDSYNPKGQETRRRVERAVDILFRRRWIVIATLVVAVVVSSAMAITREPEYEATSAVLVDVARMPGGQQETIGTTPFVRGDRSVATELFIIQNSPSIASRVDQRLRQAHLDGEGVSYPVRGQIGFSQASRSVGSIIQVRATGPDPREAALLANAYAEEYVEQTRFASRSYFTTSREFLEQQEQRRRAELQEAEDALESYLRQTGTVGLNAEGAGLVNRIVMVEGARDEALIEAQMREAQIASMERELTNVNPQLAQRLSSDLDLRMQSIRDQVAELEGQRRQMERYDASVGGTSERQAQRLEALDARIAALQTEMSQIAERYVDEAMSAGGYDASPAAVAHAADLQRRAAQERIALEGLQARVRSMNQRLGQYQGQLGSIPQLSTELARLERTKMHAEQMYQYVVDRLQETRIAEESEPGYARVVRSADVPAEPLSPGRWRTLALGMLFGLIGGVGLALLRDRVDTRVYKLEQLQDMNLRLLGIIPNLKPSIQETHGGATTTEREGVDISTSLVTLLDPLSPPSEAYRHVRTCVQFSRMDQVIKKMLITSGGAGEGKSTTAANIAITMAQASRRTVIIDADLRRPNQHKLFGIEASPGLGDILTGNGRFGKEEITPQSLTKWIDRFRSPHHPFLHVIPVGDIRGGNGGNAAVNPAELIGSPRMRQLLDSLSETFDVVVIDAPPVLAATDAVLLSTQADATLMIARAGVSKEADLYHSGAMLKDVGAYVAGVLLNGFDLSMAYGYRYSYGHYTSSGPYSAYSIDKDSKLLTA
jgi:polysaccharide biosynthesis transport protein